MQKTLSKISLPALRRNALKIKSLAKGGLFYAVVKADGYGHGAEEVARAIEDICDGFCVAIVEEGIALRAAGIIKDILVLTPPLDGYDAARIKAYNLTATVNSVETANLICGQDCHIKVNTGMNRNGCNSDGLADVLQALPPESIKGVYSHLFAPENLSAAQKQRQIFLKAVKEVKRVSPNAVPHLAASGGLLRGEKFLFGGVRVGILLYGYAPGGFKADGFEPVLKVYARRTQQTEFIGGGVGYNFADKNYKRLSVYRAGYADGFSRIVPLGEKTLCMDCYLSEDDSEMSLIMGNADVYAKRCKTISYEVLTRVTQRSERVYER